MEPDARPADPAQRRPPPRRRFATQIAWLAARIAPDSHLGLRLTLGVSFMLAGAWLFGGIAEDLLSGDPLTEVDVWLAQWLQDHAVPAVTVFLSAVSRVHETLPVLAATALLMGYFWRRRHHEWLLVAALCVPGGMLLNWALKQAFHRPRPRVSDYALALHSYSFPSGHTVAATLLYGLLAVYLISVTSGWLQRSIVVVLAPAAIATVAFSRLYLGAHYLSDVLAAMGVGAFWLALCTTGVHSASAEARARAARHAAAR